MPAARISYGLIGALDAFALKRVSRHVEAQAGAHLHRGLTRATTHVVLGRRLLRRPERDAVETRIDQARASGLPVLSEAAFLRRVGLVASEESVRDLSRNALIEQSRLPKAVLDRLVLFDAFETGEAPFSFRDLILARKYAGLIAGGADWMAIARSVHDVGPVGSLTALSLMPRQGARILARDAQSLTELNGQRLLAFEEPDDAAEDYFAHAEMAEARGLFAEAATLYAQCLALDATDATAAFNLGNCRRALGDPGAALLAYAQAIKHDADFVEAWFNLGGVLRELGKVAPARDHLRQAIARDPDYADAIYNLAALEFDQGDLAAAEAGWRRYLELDTESDWARRARAGLHVIAHSRRRPAG